MRFNRIMFIGLCCFLAFLFWSCAGSKQTVQREQPAEQESMESMESGQEIARKSEPASPPDPMEWKAALENAEVKMNGQTVRIPREFRDYALIVQEEGRSNVDIYLQEGGRRPVKVMECISDLEPDREGKIAFRVTDMNREYLEPLFGVLGLRVLDRNELRDEYYLFGSFDERGVSILHAYDMNSSVVFRFTRT